MKTILVGCSCCFVSLIKISTRTIAVSRRGDQNMAVVCYYIQSLVLTVFFISQQRKITYRSFDFFL